MQEPTREMQEPTREMQEPTHGTQEQAWRPDRAPRMIPGVLRSGHDFAPALR